MGKTMADGSSNSTTARGRQLLPQVLERRIENSRSDLMHGLKASEDLVRGIKEWTTGDLYKATAKRQVLMQLQRNADGSVMG